MPFVILIMMAEEVETGGLMRFRYSGEQAKLSDQKKKEIEAAYQQADERKKKEKLRKKIIWISMIILVVLSITLYFTLK